MFTTDYFNGRCEYCGLCPDLSSTIQASCVMVHRKDPNLGPMTVHSLRTGRLGGGVRYHGGPIFWFFLGASFSIVIFWNCQWYNTNQPVKWVAGGGRHLFTPTSHVHYCIYGMRRNFQWMSLIFFKIRFSSVKVGYTLKIVVRFWTRLRVEVQLKAREREQQKAPPSAHSRPP
jgi:hypothetical protein